MSHFDKQRNERYFNVKVRGLHFNLVTSIRKSKYYDEVPRTVDVINEALEHFFRSKIVKHMNPEDVPELTEAIENRRRLLRSESTKKPISQAA